MYIHTYHNHTPAKNKQTKTKTNKTKQNKTNKQTKHKTKTKNKYQNVVPSQNGGQITDFCFASFQFWSEFEKKNAFPKEFFNE